MEGGSVGHNFERDPPKDHPCQVWFNLVQGFQRRNLNVKVYNVRRTTSDGKSSHGLWPGELKMNQAKKHLHNTHPLSGNIKFICSHFKTEKEKLTKDSPFFLFLKLVQINIIFATMYVVKHVLRGHLWNKEKVAL